MDSLVAEEHKYRLYSGINALPVKNILHPMMGMRKLLVLETNLKERFRWNSVKMSCIAAWDQSFLLAVTLLIDMQFVTYNK